MIILKHYMYPDHYELEAKMGYSKNFNVIFHKMLTNGFKYNKIRRTFFKSVYNKEYAIDTFNRDIESIKKSFDNFKIQSFKLMNEEKNY